MADESPDRWPASLARHARRNPNPADARTAALFREGLARDLPGQPTDNRYTQSTKDIGVGAIANNALAHWLSRSTVTVQCRKQGERRRKALATPGYDGEDDEFVPADPSHWLVRLFDWLNPVDTWPDLCGQWVKQRQYTGNVHVYAPVDEGDEPPQNLWILPTAWMWPIPADDTSAWDKLERDNPHVHRGYYPYGAWRFTPQWGGPLPMNFPLTTNVILDARDVLHYKLPHALFRWDGYSPTSAMARELDAFEAVGEARTSAMRNSFDPSVVVSIKGVSHTEAQAFKDDLANSYGGVRKARKVFVTDQDSVSVEHFNTAPIEMDFIQSWEQLSKVVLAGYGVTPTIVGLTESPAYAAWFAALKQFLDGGVAPIAEQMAAFLTKRLAYPYCGRDYRIQIDLPRIDDREELRAWVGLDLYTHNEARALQNLDPVEGGDVPTKVYLQQLAPQPAAPESGAPDAGNGLPQPGEGHPLDSLGDAALEALGVTPTAPDAGGQQPTPAPSANGSASPGANGTFGKAFGGGAVAPWDESKHRRGQGGKFGSGGGAPGGAAGKTAPNSPPQGVQSPNPGQVSPNTPQPVPPEVANHPKARAAIQSLAAKAGHIAAGINAAMLQHGIGPEDLLGTFDDWARILTTRHADAVSHATGLDYATAAHLLTHVLSSAWTKVRGMLKAGQQEQPPSPQPSQGHSVNGPARQDGAPDGGPPRPENPEGAGTLPSRLKAFGKPDLRACLDELVEQGAT